MEGIRLFRLLCGILQLANEILIFILHKALLSKWITLTNGKTF